MAKKSFHVVPHENGWALKEEGRSSPLSTFNTQREAIEEGRNKAYNEDEEVDLVVHRQDGKIRERITFSDAETTTGTASTATSKGDVREVREVRNGRTKIGTEDGTEVEPRDLKSVGTRVRWSAILAGVVTALSTFLLLTLLGTAMGLSLPRDLGSDTFSWLGAIWAGLSLLVSMFLGGYAASQIMVGETKGEAPLYGVLVWGTIFVLLPLLAALASRGGQENLLSRWVNYQYGATDPQTAKATEQAAQDTKETAQQAYETGDAARVAWTTFATGVLSLLAAIAGALVGSGPELTYYRERYFRRRTAQNPPMKS